MKEELANAANRPGTSGGTGNQANILEGSSAVSRFLMPGEIRQLTVQASNTGSTTWSASSVYRLASISGNTVTWSSFPQCGGYSNQ